MADLIWLIPILPLVGVFINGLLLTGRPHAVQKAWSGKIAAAMVVIAFGVALTIAFNLSSILGENKWHDSIAGSWIQIGSMSIPLGLRIDPLSVTMMLVVTGVGSLIHIFSIGYMADDPRVGRFFTYLNLFMFAMLTLVLANNYVLLFVGWEGVGLCSYLLIGYYFEKVSAAQAGKKAFLVNRVGDFGFVLGMFALWSVTGTLTFNTTEGLGVFDAMAISRIQTNLVLGGAAATTIALLFFVGCTGKSAQLPLYLWLPDAMEGPTPVSALIHAATMVTAGVYLIARSALIFGMSEVAQNVVTWVGIITALWAALMALKQYDIKRVLAYSTVSQLGYMFVGVGVGNYAAGVGHLVTHAFFKALMFLGAGAVMHALDGQLDMRKMGNIKAHMKWTYLTFIAGLFAISGFPGLSGFFSKDVILESAYMAEQINGHQIVFWLGVFVAGLTAFYMTRMFVTVFLGSERIEMGEDGHKPDVDSNKADHGHAHDHGHAQDHGHGHGHAHVHPEQAVMNFPLIVLAIASVIGGAVVFQLPHALSFLTEVGGAAAGAAHEGAHAAAEAAHGAEGGHHELSLNSFLTWQTAVSVAAGLLGMGAAWFAFGPEKFARGWSPAQERAFGFIQETYEKLVHLIFVKGGTAFSNFLFQFVDRLVIDGAVNGMGSVTNFLADSLAGLQTGYVRNYALVMLAGAVFVGACFMWILQAGAQGALQKNLLYTLLGVVVVAVVIQIIASVIAAREERVAASGGDTAL